MSPEPNPDEDTFDPDRADDEAAEIAAERGRSRAGEETQDGAEALKSLGISFSAEAMLERLEHQPATLAEFEAAHGPVKPPDGDE